MKKVISGVFSYEYPGYEGKNTWGGISVKNLYPHTSDIHNLIT